MAFLKVSFRPSKGAARTAVNVRGKHGTELAKLLSGRAKKAKFGAVRWESRFKVSVHSISKDGRAGPTKRIVVKAKR